MDSLLLEYFCIRVDWWSLDSDQTIHIYADSDFFENLKYQVRNLDRLILVQFVTDVLAVWIQGIPMVGNLDPFNGVFLFLLRNRDTNC